MAKGGGVMNEIVPAHRLLTRAHEIAGGIAEPPPLTACYTRTALIQRRRRLVEEGTGCGLPRKDAALPRLPAPCRPKAKSLSHEAGDRSWPTLLLHGFPSSSHMFHDYIPLLAAIAPGTPWADLTEIGDTYATKEWVNNILVTWKGWLGRAALLYANGYDRRIRCSRRSTAICLDFRPTVLTSGTRDLFLSNTVRTHRKPRRAGVEADLNVYEGMSHAQYALNVDAPETKEAFTEIANFFDKHLAK